MFLNKVLSNLGSYMKSNKKPSKILKQNNFSVKRVDHTEMDSKTIKDFYNYSTGQKSFFNIKSFRYIGSNGAEDPIYTKYKGGFSEYRKWFEKENNTKVNKNGEIIVGSPVKNPITFEQLKKLVNNGEIVRDEYMVNTEKLPEFIFMGKSAEKFLKKAMNLGIFDNNGNIISQKELDDIRNQSKTSAIIVNYENTAHKKEMTNEINTLS
jgi:hypothetical protein